MNNTIETVRVIIEHAGGSGNEALTIHALDAPCHGGASHRYEINGMDYGLNPACKKRDIQNRTRTCLVFQNGPIPEMGVNGITNEALLAIVADRLRGFQSGQTACKENENALLHIEIALGLLKERTHNRMRRGVEGTRQA